MYVAVKGGETAIDNAHKLLADRRRGDRSVDEPTSNRSSEQLALAVDRVMTEGALYDRELAALAIKQARGALIEAIFLARAYRTPLPRFGYTQPVDTGRMQVERRISACFKDLPGGQLLGPTFDYTHRLLDPALAGGAAPETPEVRDRDGAPMMRVSDFLGQEGRLEPAPDAADKPVPDDIARNPMSYPMDRDARLQALARGRRGLPAVDGLLHPARLCPQPPLRRRNPHR